MLRRVVIAGLTAALIAPLYVTTPASATVLFTCASITNAFIRFDPGLSHTQSAQNAKYNHILITHDHACSNGEYGGVYWGSTSPGAGIHLNASTTYPPRPLGCPVAWGGAGPDYADQTPILLGLDGPPNGSAFIFTWANAGSSQGIFKAKAGQTGTQYRLVFNITSGGYAPAVGKKTKVKLTVNIPPYPGESYTCADDSDPLELVQLLLVGEVIVSQT